jgi:hypothetical protein
MYINGIRVSSRGSADRDYSWGTVSEVTFVRNIHKIRMGPAPGMPTRLGHREILERYKRSCGRREVWGTIDKAEVMKAVDKEIEKLGKIGKGEKGKGE